MNFPFGYSRDSSMKPEIPVIVVFRQTASPPAMFVPSWWYWMTNKKEDILERSPWLLLSSHLSLCGLRVKFMSWTAILRLPNGLCHLCWISVCSSGSIWSWIYWSCCPVPEIQGYMIAFPHESSMDKACTCTRLF